MWVFKFALLKGAFSPKKTALEEGDMGICGVAVSLVFLCGVVVNKIPSRGVAVISNHTVYGVFDFKPAMFGEKRFLADPLRCCGLFIPLILIYARLKIEFLES